MPCLLELAESERMTLRGCDSTTASQRMLRVRSSRPEPTRTIVELIGEVDMSTTCDLAAQLHTHLEESRRLVIDMSKLRFLSASGLNVLVAASNDARERGVPLSLKGGDVVQHVFEVAGLRAYFDFVDG